jgi:hypothetical protein
MTHNPLVNRTQAFPKVAVPTALQFKRAAKIGDGAFEL